MRGKDSAERLSGRRLRRAFYLVSLAVVIGLLISYWSWVDAQARAVMVISSVLDAPVLTPAAEAVSGDPGFEDIPVAGNPTLVARPAGEGPWPAIFLVNGTVREGRKLPEVRNLAEGFARAGYLVVVPDLPGLTEGKITPDTARETVEVAREVSARPDVEDREVALVGVSTGATLALLAAEKASLEGRVSVVAGIAPYSDIRTVVNIATTGHYRRSDGELIRYEADSFLPYVIAHSLVAALPPGEDRRTLSGELASMDREDPDPLSGLRSRRTDDLGPGARSVVGLLANRKPERFAALYADLPDDVRHDLEELSPLAGTGRIRVPVELATGPHDKYFPPSQSYALERVAPQRRVTVTEALDHAKLEVSPGDVPAFVTFDAFVVRSLRTARTAEN
ncbi:MAG: Alpha/beta hydrolase family [Rubrobacteraceae bacterium]|nr:Alpha/beta hydrolase family [Rubrobacteraceae bacterium]